MWVASTDLWQSKAGKHSKKKHYKLTEKWFRKKASS